RVYLINHRRFDTEHSRKLQSLVLAFGNAEQRPIRKRNGRCFVIPLGHRWPEGIREFIQFGIVHTAFPPVRRLIFFLTMRREADSLFSSQRSRSNSWSSATMWVLSRSQLRRI